MILIPYSTAQLYLLGIDYYHEVIAMAESPGQVAATVHDIEATLRESHSITDPSKDDFFTVTREGMVDQISSIIGILTDLYKSYTHLTAIGLIAGPLKPPTLKSSTGFPVSILITMPGP